LEKNGGYLKKIKDQEVLDTIYTLILDTIKYLKYNDLFNFLLILYWLFQNNIRSQLVRCSFRRKLF